jgi:hypothetical protein
MTNEKLNLPDSSVRQPGEFAGFAESFQFVHLRGFKHESRPGQRVHRKTSWLHPSWCLCALVVKDPAR